MTTDILWFSELGLNDLDRVGGKNASLGEMVQNLTSAGVQVPAGSPTFTYVLRRRRPRVPVAPNTFPSIVAEPRLRCHHGTPVQPYHTRERKKP